MDAKIINTGISDKQRRCLYAVFQKMGYDTDARHSFIYAWTNKRTESMKELDSDEAQLMIDRLNGLLSASKERRRNDELDLLRKRVLAVMYEYMDNNLIFTQQREEYAKGIAVKATKDLVSTGDVNRDFNRISGGDLSRIYNEFYKRNHIKRVQDKLEFGMVKTKEI